MTLFFFQILIASRKHNTFAEVFGDVTCLDLIDAKYAVAEYARQIVAKTNDRSLFLVGFNIKEADAIEVPSYV